MSPWPVSVDNPVLCDRDWLVAVGGGKLIDEAKILRAQTHGAKLAAVPTLWGSGAEASPIAVWTEGDRKAFRRDPSLLPDFAVYVPEFAETLSPSLARWACGDAWSHALEGFLSPLADDTTRKELAGVMGRMLRLGVKNDAGWFELSALSCAGQAKSSVGAVHGIAHVMESPSGFGHARICATSLLPVMAFNAERSPKWPLLAEYAIDAEAVMAVSGALFDVGDYAKIKALMATRWRDILRDPCTRTNSALLRPDDLAFFERFKP
jgi:alcohol dehydrogenase class IV